MKEILYIQKYIYIYKNTYVIECSDLNKLFNMNIKKVIKKYKKVFNKDYYYKVNNDYLLKIDGIVLISIIINSYYIVEIVDLILNAIYMLEKINRLNLNKMSLDNNYKVI